MADTAGAPSSPRPRGRRPGDSGSRQAVLEAARERFAADGFAGASIRKIAADAGVDAALVMRFYGSKNDLFAAVMVIPHDTAQALTDALDGPVEGIGERLVRAFLGLWTDDEAAAPMLATFRSAVTNEQAAAHLRAFIRARLLEVFVPRFPGVEDAPLRATLATTMMLGVVVGRQIIGIDALTDAEFEDIVRLLAPLVQQTLVPGSQDEETARG